MVKTPAQHIHVWHAVPVSYSTVQSGNNQLAVFTALVLCGGFVVMHIQLRSFCFPVQLLISDLQDYCECALNAFVQAVVCSTGNTHFRACIYVCVPHQSCILIRSQRPFRVAYPPGCDFLPLVLWGWRDWDCWGQLSRQHWGTVFLSPTLVCFSRSDIPIKVWLGLCRAVSPCWIFYHISCSYSKGICVGWYCCMWFCKHRYMSR